MAKKKSGSGPAGKAWIATYYKEHDGRVPARDTLRDPSFPENVRRALEARAKAVRDTPPTAFPGGSQVWTVMTKDPERGNVDMSGIFEIRDKQGDMLYRLFCVIDSNAESHGLEAPALVMLSLGIKLVRTVMPQAVYKAARAQADRYFATSPRPVLLPPEV